MIKTDINNIDADKFSLGIFLFASICILIGTLFPFTFHFRELTASSLLRFQFVWLRSLGDLLENIFLFIPLGFGLGGFVQNRINNHLLKWIFALSSGLLLSSIVESIQVLLPSRFPSSSDVLANSLGTAIGLVIFKRVGQKFISLAADILRGLKGFFTIRNLCIFLISYAFCATYITVKLKRGISFENWDESFYLIVGNEKTGDRWWQGDVFNLKIFDQALSKNEIRKIFYRNSDIESGNSSLVCFYELKRQKSLKDKTGLNPDLIRKGKTSKGNVKNGKFISKISWLETEYPATKMIHKIKRKSQFTLAATVATADTSQSGPARIITISKDPYNRNLTLGQEGSDLIFRLRTPLTGKNGKSPELVAPNIFADRKTHNLVITYNGQSLSLFVDGNSNPSSLALSSGAVLWNYFFRTDVDDLFGYKILYYIILSFPVLFLVFPLYMSNKN